MATDPLGISFSPFSDQRGTNNNGQPNGSAPTPQEAIRVLSFRPPRTVGAASPVPGALLNSPGGAVFGGSGVGLEQLLDMLFGQQRRRNPLLPGMPVAQVPDTGGTISGSFPGLQAPADSVPPPSRAPAPGITLGQQPGDRPNAGNPPPSLPSAPSGPASLGDRFFEDRRRA